MIITLQELLTKKQTEKETVLNDIQELEYKLSLFKNFHYELHGEIESLEHVIELLNKK